MATVFSRRFFAQQGLSGSSSSMIVPAGHVWIVKQVTIYMSSSAANITTFFEDESSGAALFSAGVDLQHPGWFGFYGAIVFEAGDGFHFRVNQSPATDGADVYAGGYDLAAS